MFFLLNYVPCGNEDTYIYLHFCSTDNQWVFLYRLPFRWMIHITYDMFFWHSCNKQTTWHPFHTTLRSAALFRSAPQKNAALLRLNIDKNESPQVLILAATLRLAEEKCGRAANYGRRRESRLRRGNTLIHLVPLASHFSL